MPCTSPADCCGPLAIGCNSINFSQDSFCCNDLGGACASDADCCTPANGCWVDLGICKESGGWGWCTQDADCSSNSCCLGAGNCNQGTTNHCNFSPPGGPCVHDADCLAGHCVGHVCGN